MHTVLLLGDISPTSIYTRACPHKYTHMHAHTHIPTATGATDPGAQL